MRDDPLLQEVDAAYKKAAERYNSFALSAKDKPRSDSGKFTSTKGSYSGADGGSSVVKTSKVRFGKSAFHVDHSKDGTASIRRGTKVIGSIGRRDPNNGMMTVNDSSGKFLEYTSSHAAAVVIAATAG